MTDEQPKRKPVPFLKNISRIGDDKGVILPQSILEKLGWGDDVGQVVLVVSGENLILEPVRVRYATSEEFKAVADRVFKEHRELNERLAKS